MNWRTWLARGMMLGLILGVAQQSFAIPAFARKYKTSCATCHEGFPRLSAVGEAFGNNGFKFVDEELYIKDEPVDMGDEAYKRVFPESLWPSDIPGLPPLAGRVLMDATIDTGGTDEARTEFDFPHELELFFGGSFGDNMSFFGELEWEDGAVGVAAWLQFEDLLLDENLLNIKVGTVGDHSFGLPTQVDSGRLTKEHYQYASYEIPGSANDYRIRDGQPGFEINGFGSRFKYAAGVVNGSDGTSEKDIYGQLAIKFGGLGFDGSGSGDGASLGSGNSWEDDSITVSGFGYSGKFDEVDEDTGIRTEDDFWRLGLGGLWKTGDLQVGAGYIWGNNDEPYPGGEDVDSEAAFVEASYFLFPWVIPTVRYETLELDLPDGAEDMEELDLLITSLKFRVRANVSITLEGRFFTENDAAADRNDDDSVVVRFDYAF